MTSAARRACTTSTRTPHHSISDAGLIGGGSRGTTVVSLGRARSNRQTWRQIQAFYEGLIPQHSRDRLAPLLWLVRQIAPTERARSFRAGPSLWRLVISTAARHGLSPEDPFVLVARCPGVAFGRRRPNREPRFRVAYHGPRHNLRDVRLCSKREILPTFDAMLELLRSDSGGQRPG